MEQAADLLDAYPHVASVTARVLVGPDQREDPTCRLMADSPLDAPVTLPGRPILGLLAGATAFRRDAFMQAGGYHPRYFSAARRCSRSTCTAPADGSSCAAPHGPPSPVAAARRAHARRVTARNAVWTAWLRWPAPAALRQTVRLLPRLWRDRMLARTFAGLAWILRERRTIPPHVERLRRQLERDARRDACHGA